MDRLTRTLAGCGLALLASAGGCRTAHNDVPPGRTYHPDGRQEAAVGFSTAQPERPPTAFGAPVGGAPTNVGGNFSGSQTPGDYSGTVPGRSFGGPGTSGMAQPTPGGPYSGMIAQPAAGGPLSGLGKPPALGQPSRGDDPDSINGFSSQPPAAGSMGSVSQAPSPL